MTKQKQMIEFIRKETASRADKPVTKKAPADNAGTRIADAVKKIEQAKRLLGTA